MAEPYIGEIRLFPWTWPPRGWMPCDGRVLAIQTNQVLFSLVGTTYGGNGTTTFALPDMRGRVAMHVGANSPLGSKNGLENVMLTTNQMPLHNHLVGASTGNGDVPGFSNNCMATAVIGTDANNLYAPATGNLQSLAPDSVSQIGGNQPHQNCQPSLVLGPCIAVNGIYPSRN